MLRRRAAALLATGAITAIASLAACGDPITASRTWQSASTLTSKTVGGVTSIALTGPLVDAKGKPVPNTLFKEACTQIGPVGAPAPAYRCLVAVNTGSRLYVAGGDVAGPYGKLASLSNASPIASITLTNLSADQNSNRPLVEIYAAQGLNGNARR